MIEYNCKGYAEQLLLAYPFLRKSNQVLITT